MARILFISKQKDIIRAIAKDMLPGHFIDEANSLVSAKHFLRNPTLDYDLIVIDNAIEGGGAQVLKVVTSKFPEANVIGISENLGAWPEAPGTFHHVLRYMNPDTRSPAWRKEDFKPAFSQLPH